jgi:SAM-dependent MidA family methyltransferase
MADMSARAEPPRPPLPAARGASLPVPSAEARALSDTLAARIDAAMAQAGGFLTFEAFMDLALYAPGLGYYSAGSRKLAEPGADAAPDGDFTTAPQMTPLYAQALARQVAELLRACDSRQIVELGAGSGELAAGLIEALAAAGLEVDYAIVEVSADLRARQAARLQGRDGARVRHLEALPERIDGVVLANEVFDALPVRRIVKRGDRWLECGLERHTGSAPDDPPERRWAWAERAAEPALAPPVEWAHELCEGYRTEIGTRAQALVRTLGERLGRGALLIVDYGFPEAEYYHPQRSDGTLMAHVRHRAHGELRLWPGLQDLTAHVDFTALAVAGQDVGLEVLGFTGQGRFLLNLGLLQLLQNAAFPSEIERLRATSAVQRLLAEHEMGELFKVLLLARGLALAAPPQGFASGNRVHRL